MNLTGPEFIRLANNFYNQVNVPTDINRIALDSQLFNYINGNTEKLKVKYRVAFCWICLNEPYWQYAKDMIEGANRFFLPGHQVDYFVWSDMPPDKLSIQKRTEKNAFADGYNAAIEEAGNKKFGATIFPTDPQPWPIPTLMRFHLFLQQEEVLKDYDYIFYCDVDMKFVNVVGDEILGPGLTAALHPGYAINKKLWPPYEPNENSASYISRPGLVINDPNVKMGKRFMPMYFAGGFQGGRSKDWFKAMKVMKGYIDKDLTNSYTPIWNDETAWNKYLEKTPKNLTVLTPSYIYPDSLINEYYHPYVWGKDDNGNYIDYTPKLITLTKPFTTSKEGGQAVQRMI